MTPRAALALLFLAAHACSDGEERGVIASDAGSDAADQPDAGSDAADAAHADADADTADAGSSWPVISQSSATQLETETHLAIASDGTVLVTWIGVTQNGQTHIGYAFGPNEGGAWQAPALLQAPGGRLAVDPVATVDDLGAFHLSFIGLHRDAQGLPFDMRVFVATAPQGTSAFSAPVDVTGAVPGDEIDKTWAATDAAGRLYVTWNDPSAAKMRVAVSEDGAKTFTTRDVGESGGFLVYPCLDRATGRLHVVHHQNQAVGHLWSDDQGKTWSSTTQVSSTADEPAVFNSPTCVAHAGEIWIAYGVGTDGYSPSDLSRSNRIRIARSSDGGQSYQRFYGEDPLAGSKFLHPQLARGDDGRLSLLYYAGSDANPDPSGSLRLSESENEGATWSASEVVHAPITFLTARPVVRWLGDYVGLTTRDGDRFGAFADNGSGASHVRFFHRP